MSVYCQDCKHADKTGPTWSWLCRKHPSQQGFGFVTREWWDKDAPFLRCKDVNAGSCPLFEEAEDASSDHSKVDQPA